MDDHLGMLRPSPPPPPPPPSSSSEFLPPAPSPLLPSLSSSSLSPSRHSGSSGNGSPGGYCCCCCCCLLGPFSFVDSFFGFFGTIFHLHVHCFLQCRGRWGYVLVTEFRGMTLNDLFCADVLGPLALVPLIDFTFKYHTDPLGSTQIGSLRWSA